jgi:uncharacterized protein YuzE
MTISYDKIADVLYITFEAGSPDSYIFVENREGDVLKVDSASRRVVGCTVLGFAKRVRLGQKISIPEVGAVPFNQLAEELIYA